MTEEKNLQEVLKMFYDKVSPEDMLYAKVEADITSQIVNQRLKRSMTQKDFAAMLECSQAYISKLESAEGNYTVKKLCKIAVKLDMDLEVVFKPNAEKMARGIIEKVKNKENKPRAWNVFQSKTVEDTAERTDSFSGKEITHV